MKLCFFALLLFIYVETIAQDNLTPSYQGALSINLTNVHDNNTRNALGYGALFNIIIPVTKSGYLRLGMEYNRINLVKDYVTESPVSYSEDVSYAFQYMTLPLSFGGSIGDNISPFFEVGLFFDLPFGASRKGTITTIYPSYSTADFSSSTKSANVNFGPMFTIGVKIPIQEINLIVCSTYKLGQDEEYGYRSTVLIDRFLRLAIGVDVRI